MHSLHYFSLSLSRKSKNITAIVCMYVLCVCVFVYNHHIDVIMTTMASQITSLTVVYSAVYSDADQRKHQSSVSLAFVWGIHRGLVNSPHKGPVTRKMFPFDDVIIWIIMWTIIYHEGRIVYFWTNTINPFKICAFTYILGNAMSFRPLRKINSISQTQPIHVPCLYNMNVLYILSINSTTYYCI